MMPILTFSNNSIITFDKDFLAQNKVAIHEYKLTYGQEINPNQVRIYTNQITENIILIFAPDDFNHYIWYMPEYRERPQNFIVKDNTGFLDITNLNKKYSWVRDLFEHKISKEIYYYIESWGIIWKWDNPADRDFLVF